MKKFIDDSTFEEANIIVFGISFDEKSKLSLERLRELNWFIESFDINKKKDLLKNIKVSDIGDLKFEKLEDITPQIKNIIDKKKIPLALRGFHQISFYILKAFDKNVKLIVFDAHVDIKNSYMDERIEESVKGLNLSEDERLRFNCTTWLRRYCELGNPKNVMIVGLRSCDEDDFKYINENGISYFTPNQIRKDMEAVKEKIRNFVKNSNVYISIDIDVFDPSIAPAVYHPEPNGLTFSEFSELIKEISNGKIVGIDIAEIKPIENEITEFLTIRSIFEVLSYIK